MLSWLLFLFGVTGSLRGFSFESCDFGLTWLWTWLDDTTKKKERLWWGKLLPTNYNSYTITFVFVRFTKCTMLRSMGVGVVRSLELGSWMGSSVCQQVFITLGGRDGRILCRVSSILLLHIMVVGWLEQDVTTSQQKCTNTCTRFEPWVFCFLTCFYPHFPLEHYRENR